jgi:hypothetical protein
MGVFPDSLQPGLNRAEQSLDTTPPTSTITAPTDGSNVAVGSPIDITGTAADANGLVAAVEVSVDGGATWMRADGRGQWHYTWTPSVAGNKILASRAVDDSGNLEKPEAMVNIIVS